MMILQKSSRLRKSIYLENVMNHLIITDDISVGLLIGGNSTKAQEPIEIVCFKNGGPCTFKT